MTWKRCVALVVLGAAVACTRSSGGGGTPAMDDGGSTADAGDSGSSPRATRPCDPLSVAAAPIVLGPIVGAGRASDGTIYVIDRGAPGFRAFISQGNTLRRFRVLGSGETPTFVTTTLDDDPTTPLQVKVDLDKGVAKRMGVYRGQPDPMTKTFEIGVQGEELVLVDKSALAGFTLVNILDYRVAYDATTPDGHRVMELEPLVDFTDDRIRLFYGPDDRMEQRKILSVATDNDLHLMVDIDGVQRNVLLAYCQGNFGPSRIDDVPLTSVPGMPSGDACPDGGSPARPTSEELVKGLAFYCFDE
jgi:hypothetical protein